MPSPVKRWHNRAGRPVTKVKKIRWGRGYRRVKTYGKYRRPKYRTIKRGKRKGQKVRDGWKWSYAIKPLDRMRTAKKSRTAHRKYPHTVDLPRRKW